MFRRRHALLALAAAAPLALAGCGTSSSTAGATLGSTSSGAASSGAASASSGGAATGGAADSYYALCEKAGPLDKEAFLATAERARPAEKTAHLEGVVEVQGGQKLEMTGDIDSTDQAAPKAHLTATGAAKLDMIMADKAMYVADPRGGGTWLKMSAQDLTKSAGLDVSSLTDPTAAMRKVKDAITKIECKGREKVGDIDTAHIVTTLDTAKMMSSLATATPSGKTMPSMPPTLDSEMWVDAKQRPIKATSTTGTTVSTFTYSKWGDPVTITPPPESAVSSMPVPAS